MSLIGERVTVVGCSDPGFLGRKGEVVLESAKTFSIQEGTRIAVLQKAGTTFRLAASGGLVSGDDLPGRLEERIRWKNP